MDWFPWYPGRYREKTLHLTAEQDGIYRRLIDHYMETRKPLPDNDAALARIAGVDPACFKHASSMLRAFFEHRKDGVLTHKTCDAILNEQDAKSKYRTERAKKAAEKRWSNQDVTCYEHATSMPTAMLGDARVKSKQVKDKSLTITPIVPFEDFWSLYPKQRAGSKPKAVTAYHAAIKRGHTAEQILEGVKNYARSDEVARGFGKGCAAWLNDDRFTGTYQPVGISGNTAGRTNRGFDALAAAAGKIQADVEGRELARLKRENPALYFQRLADQSRRENGFTGSLEASDRSEHDAPPVGLGYDQENRPDREQQ